MVKNLPAMLETRVRSLGWEDPLENRMSIHSSIPAWRIPWTQELGGLQSMGSQRVRHDWVTFTFPSGSHGLLLRDCLCASLAIRPFSSLLTPHSPELWGMQRWGTPASHAPAPTIFPANPSPWGIFPWRDFISNECCSVVSSSLRPHVLYSPQNSSGQNTGVGSISLLQGIFPTQGSNPGLPHCRRILYQLSYQGSPRILEWVACPFSSGSSQPRSWTRVSCIAGGFFTNWAVRQAQSYPQTPPPKWAGWGFIPHDRSRWFPLPMTPG